MLKKTSLAVLQQSKYLHALYILVHFSWVTEVLNPVPAVIGRDRRGSRWTDQQPITGAEI